MSYWKDKKVVVTGHSGFVGSNLCRRLVDEGASVLGLDIHTTSPSLRALGVDVPALYVDVSRPEHLRSGVLAHEPDAIFHLAGLGHIADCQQRPAEAFLVNSLGTVNLLDAALLHAPKAAVVCASSNHAYIGGVRKRSTIVVEGQPRKIGGGYGLTELSPLQATDAYGASKVVADHAVRCYRESYGLRAAALRHVNCFGPADVHGSHLVTGAILSCLKGERPVLKSDGTAIKCYLHVDDVVSGYLAVAENIDKLPGHAVNVTEPGCEVSALGIARAVMEVAGLEGGPVVLGEDLSQKGYEERLDATLIKSLGWSARYTIHSGIKATFEWYKAHGGMAWLES